MIINLLIRFVFKQVPQNMQIMPLVLLCTCQHITLILYIMQFGFSSKYANYNVGITMHMSTHHADIISSHLLYRTTIELVRHRAGRPVNPVLRGRRGVLQTPETVSLATPPRAWVTLILIPAALSHSQPMEAGDHPREYLPGI